MVRPSDSLARKTTRSPAGRCSWRRGRPAAGLLAACSGSKPLRLKVRSGVTVQRGDVSVLNGLLDLEQRTIAAYTAGIPLLRRPAAKAAQQFLAQELAHAQALSDLIKKAGGKPDKPRSSYDLGNPTTEAAVLTLLRGLENGSSRRTLP